MGSGLGLAGCGADGGAREVALEWELGWGWDRAGQGARRGMRWGLGWSWDGARIELGWSQDGARMGLEWGLR